ncbi:MAG: glycosyltransferase family 39 protein [bacterium]|nr:glycosyltransferase family 39 protein [bacterium]
MKRGTILLFLIFILAATLRFYKVGEIPPSLTWDEVSLGYNAYSIGETLKDEHGRFLPYDFFSAFGDYKPPLYIYADVLPIKIFGLNEFAVRFPSALAGTLAVVITYFLVLEMFANRNLALLTSLLLAISPWHTQLSRAAFEANLASFLIILGAFLLFKGLKRPSIFPLAAIPFAASIYTFNSARIAAPLLLLGFVIIYLTRIWPAKKWIILTFVLAGILILPLLPHLTSKEGRLRFNEVNIFTDLTTVKTANERIDRDQNVWWANILHNRRVGFSLLYLNHYFDHFNPDFLFIKGDGNPKFSLQDMGELYIWEFPFIFAGLYFLVRQKNLAAVFVIFWMLAAIAPAATARETPHALRIENSLPTWQIISAFGVFGLAATIKKQGRVWGKLFVLALGFVAFFSFYYYLHNYYNHYPREFSNEWQYGYKEAINYVSQVEQNYDRVVMTEALGRPYIYLLFYKKYDPEKYWQSGKVEKDAFGFYHVASFDKYFFGSREVIKRDGKALFIASPFDVPPDAKILKTIPLLNGENILTIYE